MKTNRAVLWVVILAAFASSGWAQANFAKGKTYTSDPPLRTDWLGDAGGELTDGDKTWGWDPVTGWDGGPNPRAIVIDLGEVKDAITSVRITNFVSISSAATPQKSILVSGSSTSETDGFTEWGEAVTEDTGEEANRTYTWTGDPMSARWVMVTLDAEAPGGHTLISEIEVLGLPTTEPPVVEGENFALGQSYETDPPVRTDWLGDTDNKELTNGDKTWGWDPVTGWDGGPNPRTVTVDLGAVKNGIRFVVVTDFISTGSAVSSANQVLVSGSTTGSTEGFTEWGEAFTWDTGDEKNYTYIWQGDPASARWVQVSLDAAAPGWHFLLSEVEVFGSATAVVDWAIFE